MTNFLFSSKFAFTYMYSHKLGMNDAFPSIPIKISILDMHVFVYLYTYNI